MPGPAWRPLPPRPAWRSPGGLPTPAERLSSCALEKEGPPLVGTVTEGGTGLPLWGAAVTVHGDLLG